MIFTVATFLLISCDDDDVLTPVQPDFVLAGGEATIFSAGPDAYTFPLPNLDGAGAEEHFIADGAFGQQFVSAPAEVFGGVGPLFNQNSCEACHTRNGRGAPPRDMDDLSSGLLLRLSVPGAGPHGEPTPVPGFGGQLQTKAIFGTTPEGRMSWSTNDIERVLEDGTRVALTHRIYSISAPYMALPPGLLISSRTPPPVHGLGLLEAIPDEDILALADELDSDGDGISGKVNRVWDVLKEDLAIGRFGWKAEQPTAKQQAAGAAHNDMGLTNYFFSTEHCEGQDNCQDGLQGTLDVDDETTDLFAFYFQTLAVPARRNYDDPAVIRGEELFHQMKCASCHVPEHQTGAHDIAALQNQKIYPYTDMLLHDMGDELSDQRPTFLAEGNEWRTPPLWGIGLAQIVNPNAGFLHDGRAKTIEEAILWHGGEAQSAREAYMSLSLSEREDLLDFLKSL